MLLPHSVPKAICCCFFNAFQSKKIHVLDLSRDQSRNSCEEEIIYPCPGDGWLAGCRIPLEESFKMALLEGRVVLFPNIAKKIQDILGAVILKAMLNAARHCLEDSSNQVDLHCISF